MGATCPLSITNPIKNAAGNTVSFGTGAAVRVDGATTKVTISGL
jgi:hypothetical protein